MPTMQPTVSRGRFLALVKETWPDAAAELRAKEREARAMRDDPDWFWNVLVNSFCTNGHSSNLPRKRAKYGSKLRWAAVSAMSPQEREALFFDLPNGRRRHQLTPALHEVFRAISEVGGPPAMAERYMALTSGRERMAFLACLPGVGAKYKRNIPMDVYDELVLDEAALDSRLHKLLDRIEGTPRRSSYSARVDFLRSIQRDAEIPTLWLLDRLLYERADHIEARL